MPRLGLVDQLGAGNAPKLPARLQAAVDKSEIAELLYTFCRGLDRMDENLLRSVCHPEATIDLGPGVFQGTSADYVPWVLGVLQQARSSHHLTGNIRADIEGDVALVESYVQTHFRLDKPTGREDVFLGGRYLDRMERRPAGPAGVWKIVHRKQILDWTRTEVVSEIFYHQNPDALWSYRTKTDPSYQMAQFPGSQSGGKLPAFLGRKNEVKNIKF
ncbi:MAG: nuclear transport factor 2 family protein [Alphaproteobacteria bacterium]|nr:nuclear transport factor 2 family protein [Alphaproteobacteria bacterium]